MLQLRNAGIWVGLFLLVASGVIFWQSLGYEYYSDYGPGPGLFPRWISGILFLLSLVYIWDSIKKEIIWFNDILPKGKGLYDVLSIFGSLILFMILVPFTGYSIASLIMLVILFAQGYKWYWGLGLSAVITAIVFFAFETLLNVPLPVNSFGL